MNKAVVGIGKKRGPYDNTRTAMSCLPPEMFRGRRVLIKPNAGRVAAAGSGVVTHPDALAACIDAIMEHSPARVVVGDSPILGVNVKEAYEISGMAEAAASRGIELLDLDEAEPVMLEIPRGRAIKQVKACRIVEETDVIISLAVLKMHMHTGVSLSIKNIKGLLYRHQKVRLHQLPGGGSGNGPKPLDVAIVDLLDVLKPHVAVIDGWIGMEGLGPSAGTPRKADLAVCSTDPVAADATACRLIGIEPMEVHHIRLAAERNHGIMEEENIVTTVPLGKDDVVLFARPPRDIALAFPDVVLYDEGACSACTSTTLMFLQRFAEHIKEYRLQDGKLHIVIGSGTRDVPEGTIVIGNCARLHREKGSFAPGCPPVASAIFKAVTGRDVSETSGIDRKGGDNEGKNHRTDR